LTDTVENLAIAVRDMWSLRRTQARDLEFSCGPTGMALLYLLRDSQQVRVSDLAARLDIDTSVASRQVSSLMSHGYVQKMSDPADGRSHLVRITPEGGQVLRALRSRLLVRWREALRGWSEDELAQLTESLERLRVDLATSGLFHGSTETRPPGSTHPRANRQPEAVLS
jgi:DNA-binding MarR family transcriptional regulator